MENVENNMNNVDVYAVVNSIREEVQSVRSLVDLHVSRLDKCEYLLADHIRACAESKAAISEVKIILEGIKSGLKATAKIRDVVVWLAATAVTFSELWRAFH